MKFQQTIECEAGQDMTKIVILFDAPTWDAAAHFGNTTKRHLGVKGVSTITYAPRHTDPAPLSELLEEDAERARFDRENPHPHVPGQRYLSDAEGHR